jgi:His/Glu/Gln/Arg/opine family amino acid ABC transporter permease subunit
VTQPDLDPTRPPPPKRRRRVTWLDAALAALCAGALGYFVWRTHAVLDYRWNWSTIWPFVIKTDPVSGRWVPNLLIEGLFTTIRLAVWGILVAGVLGTLMGLARTSRFLLLRLIADSYVLLIRNIPPVVFVFVFVFFIASQIMPVLGIGDRVRDASPTAQWWISILFGPPKLIDNLSRSAGSPALPTAMTTRPQLASSPAIAVFTSGELAMLSAIRWALASLDAPSTRTVMNFDAPSPSRTTRCASWRHRSVSAA